MGNYSSQYINLLQEIWFFVAFLTFPLVHWQCRPAWTPLSYLQSDMGHALSSSRELDRMGIVALLITRRSSATTLRVRQLLWLQLHPSPSLISFYIHLLRLLLTVSTVLPRLPPPSQHLSLLQQSTILSRPSLNDMPVLETPVCSSVHESTWKRRFLGPLQPREKHSLDFIRTWQLLPLARYIFQTLWVYNTNHNI